MGLSLDTWINILNMASDFLKATSLRTLSSGTKSYFYCFNYQIYKILVLNFYLIFYSHEIIIFRWFSNEMKKMKNNNITVTTIDLPTY